MARLLLGNGTTTISLFDAAGSAGDATGEIATRDVAADVEKALTTHGAALLRGFGVDSPTELKSVARLVGGPLYAHNQEHDPVTADGMVQTPVFYPPDRKLLWHNENSFNLTWPLRLLFCCVTAPDEGGETPVADSRSVLRQLDKSIVVRFTERGVRYVRNYNDGVGLDWRKIFGTDDRAEVERRCAAERMECSWSADGTLRTLATRPAVVRHPVTGELSWFNQAQHWHPSCLDAETREALLSLYDRADLPRDCQYGDGSPIEDSVMAEILAVYEGLEYAFQWRVGDVLAIDNVLIAHARNPYSGPRRLLVALADMRGFDEARES
ncbi:syringomycin biosynthesis enzyme [Actinocatenispora thailandica]|uniref:Syringomycin biosynthesis enzyme n=1 Tax=Actinocatenispora thailandica TaxID=227318 RepID=A0A7R7DLL6_9ACTN|nr:TauD/TfdA family dioxygenase [Actinocatenispora thailandica]BCJ33852.1 syringomycin biosynthesis enzyme [Actinocatenispora thailandica]